MKLGVRLPYHCADVSGDGLANVARVAESAGMHSGWVADHVVFPAGAVVSRTSSTKDGTYPRPMDETTLESWTTLAYVAAVTSRLQLGVGVCVLPYRNPLVLAKVIATLDVLSGGRVLCGAGLGWLAEEFHALGANFAARRHITEDTVALMRRCWTQSPVTFSGAVLEVKEPVHFVPRPSRSVPILFGGHSAAALRRAATVGDGWIGHELAPEETRTTRYRLAELAGGALKPDFLLVSSRLMNPPGVPGGQPGKLESASAVALADEFARYEDAGVDVLLCEPTVRTVAAHLRLIDAVQAAGERRSILCS